MSNQEWHVDQRSISECHGGHDCGGRCYMMNMDGVWRHHCGDAAVCRIPLMHDTNKDPIPDHTP